jgi:hypothetical protein
LDAIRSMGERDRTLLRHREEVNAPLDEPLAHFLIESKVVMAGQIMAVPEAMIHKTQTKSRTLPGRASLNAVLSEDRFKPVLPFCARSSLAIAAAVEVG